MATAQRAHLDPPDAGRVAALRAVVGYLGDPSAAPGIYLQGRSGVGMSTVLSSVVRRARRRGQRPIVISASYAERDVAFAGLHQVLHACRRLTAARSAIEVLTTAVVGGTVDSAVVAATGSLFGAIAADGPALIVVDNAHRLDAQTTETMARTLAGVPIPGLAVILGGRQAGAVAWPALRIRTLPGLGSSAAARLLRARAPGLNPWLADRILDDAAGRPLALIELPIAWRDRHTPGADLLEPHSPLTTRLAQSLLEDIAELPAAARRILLLVAAGEMCRPEHLRRLEGPSATEHIDSLVAAGRLANDTDGVRLADPLLAAALVQAAAPGDLRVTQEQLGGPPTHDHRDGVRRALASARAGRRGERAGRELVASALVAMDLGRFDVVAALLDALPAGLNPVDAVRRDILSRRIDDATWRRSSSAEAVCAVADTCRAAGDSALALDLLAAFAETVTWEDVDESAGQRLLTSLNALEDHQHDPRWLLVCATADPARADASARLTPGALGRLSDDDLVHLGLAMRRLGRLERAAELLGPVVPSLTRDRRFGALVPVVAALADVELFLGRWELADEHLRCATEAAERTGQVVWRAYAQATTGMLRAASGDVEAARSVAGAAEQGLGDRPVWPVRLRVAAARGTAFMAEGRFAEAGLEFEAVLGGPSVSGYAIDRAIVGSLYAEAVSRGRPRRAGMAVPPAIGAALRRSASADGEAHLRYLRTLLQPPTDLEATFTELLDRARRLPWLRARVQLSYGSWLRRERRIADAREHLDSARTVFATLPARAWLDHTEQELRAAGAVEPDAPPLGGLLSPQEFAVVQLAATGLSNREIAVRLALSRRTVESHLARAYPKLSVGSRHQLPARLRELT
ncbi:regulatory LuxR family protein [Asanoa ferruginea]|uniref:Regulatory LuxR family protein n=2 Tax=Asanoa ferruginea TaxID=53367 RepID=A0A3D9ZWW5_9ACTN|nr:regulatory LuxR family protein [Asanoa ferruginea]GIF47206.1 LuxR family transcriptional regulator [Asanoa ferruginea]